MFGIKKAEENIGQFLAISFLARVKKTDKFFLRIRLNTTVKSLLYYFIKN